MNQRWETIYSRISEIKDPYGVEVGVFQGSFSKQMLANMKNLKLVMVDKWAFDTYAGKDDSSASEVWRHIYQDKSEQNMALALENVRDFAERAEIFQGASIDTAQIFEDRIFDFVFIDADHSYEGVKSDIAAWCPKVKTGGWICGHDYPNFDGVVKAVDEIFGKDVEIDFDYTWFVRVTR